MVTIKYYSITIICKVPTIEPVPNSSEDSEEVILFLTYFAFSLCFCFDLNQIISILKHALSNSSFKSLSNHHVYFLLLFQKYTGSVFIMFLCNLYQGNYFSLEYFEFDMILNPASKKIY